MIAAVLNLHISPRPRTKAVDHVQRRFPNAHDVVDLNAFGVGDRQSGERLRLHLFGVAEDVIDFWHLGKALGLDLRRASRHDDARVRLLAPEPAHRLRRLANGLARHGAGVDDDRIVKSRVLRMTAHDLGLIRVEPAAERDH